MIDIVDIKVKAGNGGDGSVSFLRQKNMPRGGPDGGDGGRGGSIFLKATGQNTTLRAFRFKKEFAAERGDDGQGRNKFGKSGEDITIEVPLGTVIWRYEGEERHKIGELLEDGKQIRIAKGGKGGRGNSSYATPTQQTPYIAEQGEPGEEVRFRLELNLLADAGIVGKPNAGKSTLLAAASHATPKIAPYPFTTLEPMLGVVDVGWGTFVLAEIPGLIKDAHKGAGLGHEFLRHATRTRLLIHLVDGSTQDIAGAVREINEELKEYGAGLQEKEQILVVNKVDMPEVELRKKEIRKELKGLAKEIIFISAAANLGVKQLMEAVAQKVATAKEADTQAIKDDIFLAPVPRERSAPKVHKEGDVFVVDDPRAVRLVLGSDLNHWAGRVQAKVQLDRFGVSRALEEAGVDLGDTVRFGTVELQW